MGKYIRLTVRKGDQQGKTYTMKGHTRCVMGRMEDCMVHFSHPQVSRYHCLLEWDGTRLMLRDFGSLNGTYINRDRIDRVQLTDGDEVQIGKFRFTFYRSLRPQSDQ